MSTPTKEIKALSEKYNNDLYLISKEIKRLASIKCRLKSMIGKPETASKLEEVEKEEKLIKTVRDYLKNTPKTVSELTEEDIKALNYEDTVKAIRSIQSKKTHTKWITSCKQDSNGLIIPGTSPEYIEACKIETILKNHKKELEPSYNKVTEKELQEMLENIKKAKTVNECITIVETTLKGE